MMHSDSRVKEPVCLATTSLPDPCLSTYLSPRFREEPFFSLLLPMRLTQEDSIEPFAIKFQTYITPVDRRRNRSSGA